MDPFIGEIRLLPYTYAPEGWLRCEGQELAVAQYQALFTILGYRFGGNNQTTFRLPDLRGLAVTGSYSGGGNIPLFNYPFGTKAGVETVTLTSQTMPPHAHVMEGMLEAYGGETNDPAGNYPGRVANISNGKTYAATSYAPYSASTEGMFNPQSLTPFIGSGAPHDNHQPYLTMAYCIAYDGVYPMQP